jgi:phage FluMu protein Com
MMKSISNIATIKCEKCSHIFDVDSEDVDIQQSGSDEREMGEEIFYFGYLESDCPQCGSNIELTYEASEFPRC